LLILRNESELDIILGSPTALVLKPKQTPDAVIYTVKPIYYNCIIQFYVQTQKCATNISGKNLTYTLIFYKHKFKLVILTIDDYSH